MDKKVLVRKLNTLKEDKDLSVFDQFNSVNEKLRAINGVLKSINIKEVKTYQEELKTLENAILSLTESVKGKDMVVNIPLDQLSSKLDQVNNATVELYDGINATGTKIWSSGAMTNQTVPFPIVFNNGIIFQNGLYIVKRAANCNTQTIYE